MAELIKIPLGMWTWEEACIRWGAHWCHLANTIQPSMCSSDAAFLSHYFDYLIYSWKQFNMYRCSQHVVTLCCQVNVNKAHFGSVKFSALLSAQYISSIGQIIISVCLCVSEWVSQSVCHTKWVERVTGHNLSPIFTKLAIMVVSIFRGNPEYLCPSNRKWN